MIITLFIGCSSTLPGDFDRSTHPVRYGNYEVLGKATGTSKNTFILGIQTGKPALHAAVVQAIGWYNGDALINVCWYSTMTNWVILPVTIVIGIGALD